MEFEVYEGKWSKSVINLTGRQFGKLTVVARGENSRAKKARWICRCDCGLNTLVVSSDLLAGKTRSCGCAKPGESRALFGSNLPVEYNTWVNMRARCNNPNHPKFRRYGGRGIRVCERWDSFANFFADMGEKPSARHSIDRIDVHGDYCPENCKWSTDREQSCNRTNNKLITAHGETLTQSQWARRLGVHDSIIYSRLKNGWDPERAVSEPPKGATNNG